MAIGGSGDGVELVVVEVGVVDPGEREGGVTHDELGATVRQVGPTALLEPVAQVAPRQRRRVRRSTTVVGEQVAHRVAHGGGEVVVGAEHEDSGQVEQLVERLEQRCDRVGMGEVVAGVDDEVGLEGGKVTHPLLLGPLGRGEVQVAQVQTA